MNAKERFYSGLAKETIGKITSNTDNWTSFLRTMSRNYEFTYPEQVMIYAQRPKFSCVTLRLLIPSSVPRIVRISSVCSLRTKETMR